MPLFRRKSAKEKVDVKSKDTGSLRRTPSNRSRDLSNGAVSQGKVLAVDLNSKDENFETIQRKSSQLCKTLQEILHDKNSLGYFIQFLEARKAGQLIRFWLDAESFQASTWSRMRSHSLNVAKKKRLSSESDRPPDSDQEQCKIDSQRSSIETNENLALDKTISKLTENPCAPQTSVIKNSAKEIKDFPNSITMSKEDENVNNLPSGFKNFEKSKTSNDSANLCNHKHSVDHDSQLHSGSSEKNPSTSTQSVKPSLAKRTHLDLADKLKKSIENDAVRIFTKYLSQDATDPVGVDEILRNQCISKICREDGEVDPECFVDCQNFAVSKIEAEHYPSYSGSEFHLKYQIDLLTTGPIYLTDFLYNDAAFFYFMEFMEQEGGSNILQFWLAVENFEKHLHSQSGYDGMQAQSDAMVLYDKYFSLQATHPLGFDDKCRFEVEENICREEGPLPDCFDKPRKMVLYTIEKNYFPEFRQSEIFYKFLSELVGTVHSLREFPKQRKRTDSEGSVGSSTHSGESIRSVRSTKNTLLAGTSQRAGAMQKFENMNIDAGLLNPDLLWKRESPKMEIGKVDDFGQFKSEFNRHPDTEKSKGPIFFKRRKEKEKEEEEMAFKIAQMIINDVTSVTQTIGEMKSESCDVSQTSSAIDSKSFNDKSKS